MSFVLPEASRGSVVEVVTSVASNLLSPTCCRDTGTGGPASQGSLCSQGPEARPPAALGPVPVQPGESDLNMSLAALRLALWFLRLGTTSLLKRRHVSRETSEEPYVSLSEMSA